MERNQGASHRHPFSAGVVPVRLEDSGWRLLLLRSYQNWDFPKGGVEAGETPLQAAIRETREEADLSDLTFDWGEDYIETGPYGSRKKVARYYLARTERQRIILPVSPELGRPEHEEWRWVDMERAARMLPPRLQPVLDWVRQRLESPTAS
jgi:8-oxo-dGTP pyrophosphatase MutT (NUDIX family)